MFYVVINGKTFTEISVGNVLVGDNSRTSCLVDHWLRHHTLMHVVLGSNPQ